MRSRIGRFLRGGRASAAVEFALIAPFLLALYTGGSEIILGILINRQVGLVSSTLANITAQYITISAASDIPDILNASTQILAPYPVANAKVVLSSISVDANGKATIAWSKSLNTTARTAGSAITLPGALASPYTSLILGEVKYDYSPTVDFIHMGSITLAASTYMVPRQSSSVTLTP